MLTNIIYISKDILNFLNDIVTNMLLYLILKKTKLSNVVATTSTVLI